MYAVFLLGMTLVPLLLWTGWNTFDGQWAFDDISVSNEATQTLLAMLLVYGYIFYFSRDYLHYAYDRMRKHVKFLPLLYAVIIGVLFAILVQFILAWLPPPPDFAKSGANRFLHGNEYSRFIGILLIVIVAPIVEEYVFRGYIFDGIRQKRSLGFTFAITAALFTLPHMIAYSDYLPSAVILFILGLLLAYFRERFESLLPAIVLHATYNLCLVLFSLAMNS